MVETLTSAEAARRLGVNQSRVRQLIRGGQLPAAKHGRDWLINADDVNRLAESRADYAGSGRPPKTSK